MIEVNKQTYMNENTLDTTIKAQHVSLVINHILCGLVIGQFR